MARRFFEAGATLAYNVIEAVIALWFGAEAESIALVGCGLDSVVECAAAGVLLWRLALEAHGADPRTLERAERRVHRFVNGTFLPLAAYVRVQSVSTLWQQEVPQESWVGIVLAAASLVIMPIVSLDKLRAALRAEAKETLACSYLSLALLLGLVGNSTAGWWWADPVAALAMVPWLVREGMEGVRGESCEAEREKDSGPLAGS